MGLFFRKVCACFCVDRSWKQQKESGGVRQSEGNLDWRRRHGSKDNVHWLLRAALLRRASTLIYWLNINFNTKLRVFLYWSEINLQDPIINFLSSFADDRQVKVLKDYEHRIAKAIERKEWAAGFKVFDEMLNGDFYPYPTYFQNITGVTNYFNLFNPVYPPNPYTAFLNSATVRNAIHVGLVPYYGYNSTVEEYLIDDWLKSVDHFLPTLFDNYKVQNQMLFLISVLIRSCTLIGLGLQRKFRPYIRPSVVWEIFEDFALERSRNLRTIAQADLESKRQRCWLRTPSVELYPSSSIECW